MANGNEEQKKTSAIKSKQTNAAPIKNNTLPQGSKSFIAIGAVIIALSALASSLYTLSLNKQLQNQLVDKNSKLTAQLNKLEQNQEHTQTQIEAKANTLEETRITLNNQFSELNKQLQTAMNQQLYQNQNWLLLKARYYLELAQINAHWSKSFSATIRLLQQSDQLLQQINDPQIFKLRQAIAKDIAELHAIPKVDIAGILSQLDAAQSSLEKLNIVSALNDSQSEFAITNTSDTPQEKASVWHLRFQDSINLLKKLVIIRHHDEHIKPLVSPAFEALLKANIHLNLQEAQWAVLHDDPKVYQLVLTQAITTLKKNFNETSTNTAALIKKLSDLQHIQLAPPKPAIGVDALPLLNQLIDTKEPIIKSENNDSQGGTSP